MQLCAYRMFFDVGTLHTKVSSMVEMGELPVVWEVRIRCVQYWYKLMTCRIYEGRLLTTVALEAVCGVVEEVRFRELRSASETLVGMV